MGLARLVSCRFRIRRAEDCTYQCAPSSLFLYRHTRAILRLFYRTSPEDRKLESRSFITCSSKGWLWLVLGPLLVLMAFFLVFPAFVSKGSPTHWHWHPAVLLGLWFPMFNYNLFGGPLFEEFGWRGFLQVHLQAIMPPWVAAICVGVMWALWHAPLFLISWSSSSPSTYILIMVGLSILMAYAFNSSGRAVVVAILMHSAFNASSRFIDTFLDRTLTRENPSPEMFIALAFLTLVFSLYSSRGDDSCTGSPSE